MITNIPISDLILLLILLVVQIVAIFYAQKVGKIFSSKSWSLVVLAFILFLFSRIISFLVLFEIVSYSNKIVVLIDAVLIPLIFWILVAVGMIRIYYNLRSSIELEKEIKNVKNERNNKVRKKTESKASRKKQVLTKKTFKPKNNNGYMDLTE